MTSKTQRTRTQINMFDERNATVDDTGVPTSNGDGGEAPVNHAEGGYEANGRDGTSADAAAEVSGGPATSEELVVDEPDTTSTKTKVESAGDVIDEDAQQAPDEEHGVAGPEIETGLAGATSNSAATLPSATLGDPRLVPLGALSIAADNVWGGDIVRDEHFRRLQALAASPDNIEPLLVVSAGNGWAIVGDPGPYLALVEGAGVTATTMVPIREISGSKAAIACHLGRAALLGRPFRNIRRARYTLTLCELGVQGSAIASSLGLAGSAASRDIKAARVERQYPALAALLASPSEAPVSYYLDIADYADRQPAPSKAMATLAAAAARLARGGKLTPVAAKAALGIARKASTPKPPEAAGRRYLDPAAGAEMVAVEPTGDGRLRLVMTFPGGSEPLDVQAARYSEWLCTLAPPVARQE